MATNRITAAATAATVAAQSVSLKLPIFLATRPDVWFQQAEAQFALRGVTEQDTMYYYLLTSLDPVVAERMANDIASIPGTDQYKHLKQKLLEVYGLTDDQKADKLLNLNGLGDWKPSQLCAHIQSLSVDKDVILRRIFLRQLPEDVRVQVATLDSDTLSQLARKADIVIAAKQYPASINSASPASKKPPPRLPGICWYHSKFGKKARACRPPCSFQAPKEDTQPGNDQAST